MFGDTLYNEHKRSRFVLNAGSTIRNDDYDITEETDELNGDVYILPTIPLEPILIELFEITECEM